MLALEVIKALRQGKTLIVADPRKIDLARRAHLHLRLKPGTNVALLKGMMRHIVDMGWEDKEFIAAAHRELRSPSRDARRHDGGAGGGDLRRSRPTTSARRPNCSRPPVPPTSSTPWASRSITPARTTCCRVANLAMLTGQIGRPGTGVNPLRGQLNVQGACDMGGLPDVFSGYQKVDNPDAIAKMEAAWGVTLEDREKGKSLMEIMRAIDDGQIRALYVMGENPVLSDPDQHHIEATLKKVEFLVVQDIFRTETAEYADVVLPAVSSVEKVGTYTNTERRIQLGHQALDPLGDALPDWKIVQLVANRMGAGWDYRSPEQIMAEVAAVTPQYGGVTYDRLEVIPDVEYDQTDVCGLQWPCPTEDHPGTPILHTQQFARGKGLFSAIEHISPSENISVDYPFVLTTGRELVHYHTGHDVAAGSRAQRSGPGGSPGDPPRRRGEAGDTGRCAHSCHQPERLDRASGLCHRPGVAGVGVHAVPLRGGAGQPADQHGAGPDSQDPGAEGGGSEQSEWRRLRDV